MKVIIGVKYNDRFSKEILMYRVVEIETGKIFDMSYREIKKALLNNEDIVGFEVEEVESCVNNKVARFVVPPRSRFKIDRIPDMDKDKDEMLTVFGRADFLSRTVYLCFDYTGRAIRFEEEEFYDKVKANVINGAYIDNKNILYIYPPLSRKYMLKPCIYI